MALSILAISPKLRSKEKERLGDSGMVKDKIDQVGRKTLEERNKSSGDNLRIKYYKKLEKCAGYRFL
ncbi:MAG: hypothetical protein K1060chlam5_00132 [Candidatus Anoxychlamydiales bacterium]|nr:hypothetical protein [Candidatus Anoxychlamydiales bacterium]